MRSVIGGVWVRQQTLQDVKLELRLLLILALALLLAACGGDATAPVAPRVSSETADPRAAGGGASGRSQLVDVPDFDLVVYQGEDLFGGRATRFSNVFAQGKPVVLNFWAGLCPPCRAEMPAFQAIADEYADEVIVVGVDVGPFIGLGSRDDAKQLLRELDIRYPAAAAVDATPLRLYQVQGMPTTIFFAPNGEIVEKRTGLLVETQLRGIIEQLAATEP